MSNRADRFVWKPGDIVVSYPTPSELELLRAARDEKYARALAEDQVKKLRDMPTPDTV